MKMMGEAAKKVSVDPRTLAIMGVASGLVGIYASYLSPVFAAALAIPAMVWSADTVRRIAGYGLGTGVPSIGNLALSMGILVAIAGLKLQPILGVAIAATSGLIYGVLISRFKILGIPSFGRFMSELATAACLVCMCLMSAVAGGYDWTVRDYFGSRVVPALFTTGMVAAIFWVSSLAAMHPYNACLGVGERQGRTLRVAVVVAGIDILIAGIARVGYLAISGKGQFFDALAIIALGAVVWIYGMFDFLRVSMKEAAATQWTGIPPKPKIP